MADLTVSREILTQTNTGLDTMEVMILGYYVGSSKKPLPDTKNDVTVSGDLNVKGPTDAQ